MDDVSKQMALSAVRTLLAVAGAWLASHKYIDSGSVDQVIGAIMIIIPIAWGMWEKRNSEQKTKAREVVAVNTGIAVSNMQPNQITPPVTAAEVPAVIAAFAPTPTGKPN